MNLVFDAVALRAEKWVYEMEQRWVEMKAPLMDALMVDTTGKMKVVMMAALLE